MHCFLCVSHVCDVKESKNICDKWTSPMVGSKADSVMLPGLLADYLRDKTQNFSSFSVTLHQNPSQRQHGGMLEH